MTWSTWARTFVVVGVLGLLGDAGIATAEGGWEFVLEFGNGPGDIAVDSIHNVYVLDVEYGRIQVFTSEGLFLRERTGLSYARGIAIDENDEIYVVNYRHDYPPSGWVLRYGLDFQPLGGWEYAHGDLEAGLGIDVHDGLVYVGTANDMLKFATDGRLLDIFEGAGWDAVEIATDGSVWGVNSETGSGLVRHYSPDGAILAEWSTILPGEEGSYPRGLALDTRNRVFVADDGARVKIFVSDGTLDDLIQWQMRVFLALELDGDDLLYVGADFPDRVMKFGQKLVPVEPVTWGEIKSRFR